MKAGDSLIIFPRQWCAKHGRSKQHALPVRKIFPQTFRICKIQNLRSDGKQLTETQNKRIQRISKVAHSSGQWTEFGVDKMLIRSIRSYSARRKVYGDKMRYYLYLQEYISTLNWSSDTAVALPPTKSICHLVSKWNSVLGIISVWKSIYLLVRNEISALQNFCLSVSSFLFHSERNGNTEKLYKANRAVLSSSIEVYTHFGLHVPDNEAEEPP